MPIKYKVIQRGQPGVAGGGTKKYYASANMTGEKTLDSLTRDIEKMSTVSGADIRAVLYALVDVMQSALSDGNIVRMGELGSLRVSFSSEGKEQEKDVIPAAVNNAKVIFTPGSNIKAMLRNLRFEKI